MDDLTEIPQIVIELFGVELVFNTQTIFMTWIVMAGLIVFAFAATRKLGFMPNPLQIVAEFLVKAFYGLTKDALDERMAKTHFPLICGLFMFLLLSNWLGLFPKLLAPTQDLNTTLGFGIMGFFVAHYAGIKHKGIKAYTSAYFEPIFLMAPLNLIGELAKVISISFRLYGNMLGGYIIVLIVSYLVYGLVLPPFLNAFFNLFIGTIQAFVFTMLTLVYISVQVK